MQRVVSVLGRWFAWVAVAGLAACGGGNATSPSSVQTQTGQSVVERGAVQVSDAPAQAAAPGESLLAVRKAAAALPWAVYRFYNTSTGVHFYTMSETERDSVRASNSAFRLEGTAFYAMPASETAYVAVHRFYNRLTGTHFYTVSDTEKQSVQANLGHIYQYEGVGWRARSSAEPGWVPMRRFYVARTGVHFYTADDTEYATLLRTSGYAYEGVAYFVSLTGQGGLPGLDPSWGGGQGWVATAAQTFDVGSAGSALLADGRLLVAGTCQTGGSTAFCVARYLGSGALDTSFGGGGWARQTMFNFLGFARGMVIQADGKIVVSGGCESVFEYGQSFCAVRFTSEGLVDSTFGTQGVVKVRATAFGSQDDASTALAIQPDGKLLLAGACMGNLCAMRLNADGQPDPDFGTQGAALPALSDAIEHVSAVQLDPMGRVVLAGSCRLSGQYDRFCLVRLTSAGALDTSFGTQGRVVTAVGFSSASEVLSLHHLAGGGWLAAGSCSMGGISGTDACVVRYSEDGVQDLSFGSAGFFVQAVGSGLSGDYLQASAIGADGRLVMAGRCNRDGGTGGSQMCAIRVTMEGVLDTRFGTSGKLLLDLPGYSEQVQSMVQTANGRWVFAGTCSTSAADDNAQTDFCVARYQP